MLRFEGHFKTDDGRELFFQTWTPDPKDKKSPKKIGTLIVTHGQAEHSEPYHRLAEGMGKYGWETYAWDMRGNGRSPGKRGFIDNFATYSKDLGQFLRQIETQPEIFKTPIFLLGHSMGGLVTLRTWLDQKMFPCSGLILSSPFLGLKFKVPDYKVAIAHLSARFFPRLTLSNDLADDMVTSDEAVIEEIKKDPYRHGKISAAVFLGALDAIETVQQRVHEYHLPIVMQLGGRDEIVDIQVCKKFFNDLPSQKKYLMTYENSKHEIFNDIERDTVFSDLHTTLLKIKDTQC